MLHSLRRRIRSIEEREANGESLWTTGFSERVRTRVLHVLDRVMSADKHTSVETLFVGARQLILEQEGLLTLTGKTHPASSDFLSYFIESANDMYPTVIESLLPPLQQAREQSVYWGDASNVPQVFIWEVNEVFAQERVAWEIIEGQMVEMHSKELHTAVVEPAIRLLHERRFVSADEAYRAALQELATGTASDAITDAGTALQETLSALGCKGNQLGDLIRSARKKGIIAAHDDPFMQSIDRALHWVAADRSESGDAHHVTQATREDAWLIVHVVGAFIVRLASDRGGRG